MFHLLEEGVSAKIIWNCSAWEIYIFVNIYLFILCFLIELKRLKEKEGLRLIKRKLLIIHPL